MRRPAQGVRFMLQDRSLCTRGSGHLIYSSGKQRGTPPTTVIQATSAFLAIGHVWRAFVAARGRHAVRRLAQLDDRLLADVGITGSDLSEALCEPLFRNPTDLLAQRARERRQAEQRQD